jgi:hypothetical protein
MARKSIVDSDGPSTADVSANEDVEMQDQDQDTKMSGFKKFGVSATRALLPAARASQREHVWTGKLTVQTQYYQDTPDYTVRFLSPPALPPGTQPNTAPGLRHPAKHNGKQCSRRRAS